jgi:GntR family transcriptional regulator/MocR family aminotransferase
MRGLYAERQASFVRMCGEYLDGLLEVHPSEAGMHLVGWLPRGVDDAAVAACLRERGIVAAALSVHYIGEPPARGGLVLGYSGYSERQLADATRKMASVIRDYVGSTRPPVR